jgi:hypothetical protein
VCCRYLVREFVAWKIEGSFGTRTYGRERVIGDSVGVGLLVARRCAEFFGVTVTLPCLEGAFYHVSIGRLGFGVSFTGGGDRL